MENSGTNGFVRVAPDGTELLCKTPLKDLPGVPGATAVPLTKVNGSGVKVEWDTVDSGTLNLSELLEATRGDDVVCEKHVQHKGRQRLSHSTERPKGHHRSRTHGVIGRFRGDQAFGGAKRFAEQSCQVRTKVLEPKPRQSLLFLCATRIFAPSEQVHKSPCLVSPMAAKSSNMTAIARQKTL